MYAFKVEKMNCMSCFHNIEDELKEIDPSVKAQADVKNKTITIESTKSAEEIKKAIEAAGYPVNAIQSK